MRDQGVLEMEPTRLEISSRLSLRKFEGLFLGKGPCFFSLDGADG